MNWFSYGAWGAAGILAGLALVTYADPDTTAGAGLLMVVCFALSLVLRGLWSWAFASPAEEGDEKEEG